MSHNDPLKPWSAENSVGARFRVLFVTPGPMPPNPDPRRNVYAHLSLACEGDVVSVWWERDRRKARAELPLISAGLGRFRYHATRSTSIPPVFRTLWNLGYFVTKGFQLSRRHGPYDVIVAYGPFAPGIAGLILKSALKVKLIVEIPGDPWLAYRFEDSRLKYAKLVLTKLVAPLVIHGANSVKLLYRNQLDQIIRTPPPAFTFHNFVPLSAIPAAAHRKPFIYFLGHPWGLKGVDILIRAFQRISGKHPEYTLRIVGHCPNIAPFERLRGGDPRIEFHRAVKHEQAMQWMAECGIFVLPSRTEAMGRVLLEAMAARRPIVASRTGGIPTYIDHGRTGLLFRSGDETDLAEQLDILLADPEYAKRLAAAGFDDACTRFSERKYVEHFVNMLSDITRDVSP